MNSERRLTSSEVKAFVSKRCSAPQVVSHEGPIHPRISVVVPSYNQGRFLERTLISILNQNYSNTELIVIDGGSTDNSVEIINEYDSHISRWVSEPDKGQPHAINKGFAMATGDLIGWQNSDDLYMPGFFHTVAESLRMDPRAQLIAANVYIIDENDRIVRRSHFTPFSFHYLIYEGWNLSSQATFMTRALIDTVGAMREDIQVGFDWDWYIRVAKTVRLNVLHRSVGGCYRIHPASKLSLYGESFRNPIHAQILRSHGIKARSDLSRLRQHQLKRMLLRLRHLIMVALIYYPDIEWTRSSRGPVYDTARRTVSWLRTTVLWVLSKFGSTRVR